MFADRFTIPATSPLWSPRLHQLFYISLAFQHSVFHLLSQTILKGDSKDMLKKRCWILTTMASFVMCAASLPFLVDLISSGFDMHAVHPRTKTISEPLAAYFVAYLISDLSLGSFFYPSMINLSSGWIHHTAYTFLFSFWVHKGWSHIAALAAIFELPTLIMGAASIHPPLRSNTAFTATFFATRVFFHFGLLVANVTEHGRNAPGINGSWGPAFSLIGTYPMHLWWGYKCICSVRRRMHKRKLAAKEVEKQKASLVANAGQAFTGLAAPDISSAVNTPATTPGAGAIHATANFGSTGPVHSAFAKAASLARPPVNLLLPKSKRRSPQDKNVESSSADPPKEAPLLSRRLSSKYINSKSVFTAPVAPEGAGPLDAEPFLAIRSPAEAKDRARRLVADAVRKMWLSAPANWRKQFEEEAGVTRKRGVDTLKLNRTVSTASSSADDSSVDEDADIDTDEVGTRRYLASQRARVRRAVLKAVRTAINGRDADGFAAVGDGAVAVSSAEASAAVDRTLLSLDLSSLIRYLPPDFFSQDYEIREFPVERDIPGGRRKRIVGQIRRRMEVARRDMVVFA